MVEVSKTLALLAGCGALVGGCQAVHLGNLVTLGVTLCVFVGTLNLGKKSAEPQARAAEAERSER